MTSIEFELVHENLNKDAVLLFHGLTGSPYEMKKYGTFLFNLGYDVFCYSFPGHGSNISNIQNVEWTDWTKFAQEKYNLLRKKYDNFFVSGLCMGASIALYLAENNRDVTGVISLSTTLYLDGFCMPKIKILMPIALKTIFRYYYTFPEDTSLGIKNEKTRRALARVMSTTDIGMDNYPLNCVRELLFLSKNVIKNLKKVNVPTLIIHSKFDNLTSPKSAKIVYRGISSNIKKYVELNDSYHMILYDNEKDFVMDTVKEFLSAVNVKEKEALAV